MWPKPTRLYSGGSAPTNYSRLYSMTDKQKYLELLSAAIDRMSGHSFSIKGWTVALIAALLGLSSIDKIRSVATLATFVILGFWVLDAYYLSLERGMRKNFDMTRNVSSRVKIDYDMRVKIDLCIMAKSFFSTSLILYYGWLMALTISAWTNMHCSIDINCLTVWPKCL
jgi:hypothetical protein